nr:hypothetical protein [Tanacetum cinerariifolium]
MAIDEAIVPTAQRLKIGRSNFRLLSDIKSKESTLQLVYDVMCICPFFKAFLVTTDVPKIYMDILHICLRVHGQSFEEPPFEVKIIAFIHFLGHNAAIRTLTDVNINKLYQPWRSFVAIINKCLIGKSSGYDSLRLSQAQILWGLYHKRNVDYAYLMWEDFVYQDPSIPRRNKVNWQYVRDDHMFSKIKLVSRHQNTQQFSALLPIKLTNAEIRNSKAYKKYYAIATGEAAPKPKAIVRRTRSSFDTSITPRTAAASPRLTASAKGKQTANASKAKILYALSEPSGSGTHEGTGSKPGVLDVPTDESEEELSWNSTDDEGDDNEEKDADGDEEDEGDDGEEENGDDDDDEDDDSEEGDDDDAYQEVVIDDDKDDDEEGGDDKHESDEETGDEESYDPIPQTLEDSEDKGNGEEDLGLNIGEEERHVKEEDELYRDVNINQGRGIQATLAVEDSHVTLTPVHPDGMESIFGTTSQMDVQTPTSVASLPITAPTVTSSTIATTTTTSQAPILPTIVPSTIIQNLPNFGSLFRFDDRLRSLEENFSEFRQTNQFARAVSFIPGIVNHYMDQRMNEAVKVAVQIQSDWLCNETQRENEEFLRTAVNEQLEDEVLTRSSHSSRTSYVVAADLSDMELKKILIEKIEGNKSIQHSDEQRNLYKALVKAYESDKLILDTYRETVTLKRRRDDDADKDEEPFVGPDQGSKRRREGKEPESASAPSKTTTRSAGRISELAKQADSCSSFNELMDTPLDFSNFLINRLKVDTLTPELLAGPTYELMKGSCKILVELEYHLEEVFKAITDQLDWVNHEGQQYPHNLLQLLPLIPNNRGRCVIPFEHFINNDLEYLRGGASSRKYTTSITKTKTTDYGHIKWIEDLFYGSAVNQESARDVYSKRIIIDVTELKIVEWHSYKHLDWIKVRRDNDKLYKFKEGNFKRLRIQDIEDVLLLLRRVEDLQLGVESYQKKLNLTKPISYRSDLKRKKAYTAYSNPRGFIYQNKDKRNRLMRIDKLHKFSDGTLTDVRTALDDHLKGIRIQYLPQSIWRKSDKDRAAAMIQAVDKRLKTKRIMRSLERYSNLMIQPEPKGSTQGYPLVSVEVLRGFFLRLNLSDHKSILKDLQVTPTKLGRMTKPYSSHRFIANCFNVGNIKMELKEGEPVDSLSTGSITSAIGAMTAGAGGSTLGGGVSNSSNSGRNNRSQSFLDDGTNGVEKVGFGMSPELIVAGVIS